MTAGIKKSAIDEDEDFDYVYHLPGANIDYIKKEAPTPKPQARPIGMLQAMLKNSHHSIREIRELLSESQENLRPISTIGNLESVRSSVQSRFKSKTSKISNGKSQKLSNNELEQVLVNDIVQDENGDLVLVQTQVSRFKALPDIVYAYVDGNIVAAIGLGIMIILVGQVIVSESQAQ